MVAQIPEEVKNVMTRLETAGYQAWCVGGAVRDLLLGRTPGDWDVTTNALPEAVLELFAPRALPTGLKHGTVTVGGGRGVEVTTFRRDGDYLDHRHPERVEFTGSLTEDLARRDFTVNAMAMDLRGEPRGPLGGPGGSGRRGPAGGGRTGGPLRGGRPADPPGPPLRRPAGLCRGGGDRESHGKPGRRSA